RKTNSSHVSDFSCSPGCPMGGCDFQDFPCKEQSDSPILPSNDTQDQLTATQLQKPMGFPFSSASVRRGPGPAAAAAAAFSNCEKLVPQVHRDKLSECETEQL
ncbi:hypothetical protein STEG23_032452, partial [Scotinomys teguina]